MTVYELVTNFLIIAIIYVSSVIIKTSLTTYSCKKIWIDLLVGIIFIFWVGFYIFVLLANPSNSSTVIGQVLVRPALLITFVLLLVLVKLRAVRKINHDCN